MARVFGIGLVGLGMAVAPHMLALRDLEAAGRARLIGGFSPSAGSPCRLRRALGRTRIGSEGIREPGGAARRPRPRPRAGADATRRASAGGPGRGGGRQAPAGGEAAGIRRRPRRGAGRDGRGRRRHPRRRLPAPLPPGGAAAEGGADGRGAGPAALGLRHHPLVARCRLLRPARGMRPRHEGARRRRRPAHPGDPYAGPAAAPDGPGARRGRRLRPHQPAAIHRHRGYRRRLPPLREWRHRHAGRDDGRPPRLPRAHRDRRDPRQRHAGRRAAGAARARACRPRSSRGRAPAAAAPTPWPSTTARTAPCWRRCSRPSSRAARR